MREGFELNKKNRTNP